jgi:hypothetical protein
MRRFWFRLIPLACAAGATFAGCGDVPEAPTGPTTTSTTGGGSAPGTGGTTGTGGAGGCTVASDCGTDAPCLVRTCVGGTCGVADIAMGAAATTQVSGDCQTQLCDGAGAVVSTKADDDVPDDGTLCTANLCMDGVPTFPALGVGVACADHGGKVCDATGKCVGCLGPADCASGVCSMGACVDPTCTDHVINGSETDTDCGGPSCLGCLAGKKCALGSDCHDGVCTAGTCQLPTCGDGVTNDHETDTDCGGGTCPGCTAGGKCLVGADCLSGTCSAGVCG